MRTTFFVSFILLCTISQAQNQKMCQDTSKSVEIYVIVEESTEFPGGEDSLFKYFTQNLQYPELARENKIQGTVFVTFVVEKDGSITNVKILRGIGWRCDEEAIRLIKSMPKWIPGKQRKECIRQRYNLPVKFTLDKPKEHKKNR